LSTQYNTFGLLRCHIPPKIKVSGFEIMEVE